MANRTPGQIQEWLDGYSHKMDGSSQTLGDEPNAVRRDWDSSSVRWLMAACWPYQAACLAGDTLVLVPGRGPVRIESASDPGWVDCAGSLQASSAAMSNGVQKVVRVRAQGRDLVCTPDHLIQVAEPGPWRRSQGQGLTRTQHVRAAPVVWRKAGDLQPGDLIKSYYGQNLWSGQLVELDPPTGMVSRACRVDFPDRLTPELAWLLGLLATDGSIRTQHRRGMSAAVRWTADDSGVLAELLRVIPIVFGCQPGQYVHKGRTSTTVEIAATPLVRWLQESVGLEDRRSIPDSILRSPREVVAAYLSGMFDGDGDFGGRNGTPGFTQTEHRLVVDMVTLLANFGAPMTVGVRESGPGVALTQDAEYRPRSDAHALWAEDMDWSWLTLSHSTRKVSFLRWLDYRPTQPGRARSADGVSYVKVQSVEDAGFCEVWDLCVPATEAFTANSVVVHNSGNQSIPAVYKSIHHYDLSFLCDRFYLPATPRDLKLFERHDMPVFGIESKHQLADFDVVATSVAYPVLVMSFHKYLTMSDVPVRWKDREQNPGDYPMILMGGLAYSAPEVMAPIADAIFCGEAEDEPGNPGIGAITARIAEFKTAGLWRSDRIECYRRLAREFPFLYFPRFIDVHYGYEDRSHVGVGIPEDLSGPVTLSKQVVGYTSLLEGMRLPIRKRHVRVLDAIPPLDDAPLLYGDPQLGAGGLEAGRGCPAWCHFCALSYNTKPYRQHSVEYMTRYASELQQNSGAARFSPYMPDFPMYTERKNMIADILTKVSDEVDAAAMRVDDFNADKEFILLQVHGGMSGVTLGLEGGSARMRDLVGKGTSDADVEEAVYSGIRAGIRRFKIFMISNLPGEDEGDIFRVLRLARKLADIRDNLNQPQVQIQFSWTPLLIEMATPFRWFAPTSNNLALRDVWDEFRELKINFKIGGKVEVNKVSFFQLCQRASREIGEAMVDTMDELGVACWGGVPKNTKELLEKNLRKWGFHNGLEDAFDERFKNDMFGPEFIDTGISTELMWSTYQLMREFAENTDSHTYDDFFDDDYHGGEILRRCDESCMGKSCGVCTVDDLKERTGYIRAAVKDRPIDLSTLQVIDQKSVAFKIRAKVYVEPKYRFVENDHWRFSVRRAAFRAAKALGFDKNHGISKRSLRFVSDEINFKNWTCGTDYVEFGMTRKMSPPAVQEFINRMNEEMLIPNAGGERWMTFGNWIMHPANSVSVKSDVDLSLFEMELLGAPEQTLTRMSEWDDLEYVKLLLKKEGAYFNPQPEEVNAKDYVDSMWLVRDGHQIKIRMMTRGKPSPYILYAAVMGQSSWLPYTVNPAVRIDSFVKVDKHQQDILRPSCVDCENQIPTTVLDRPFDFDRCPRCSDVHKGLIVTREMVS